MHNSFSSLSSSSSTSLLASAKHPVLLRHNVTVIGEGKPPLLLCNGFGCDQRIWRYMIPALSARYQLILFDQVGSGGSDRTAYDSEKYATLKGYAQDIIEICQVLGIQQTAVVAHSVGTMIVMLAAIEAPELFSRIVMVAPSPYYLNEPEYHGGFDREDMNQLLQLMDADYNGWSDLFAALLMGPATPAALYQELATQFCTTDCTIGRQFAEVAFFADNRADLPQLQVPTLLLQCAQDVAAPVEVGAYLLKHLPQAKLIALQATGHCPHLSAPMETLAAMENFLV
ncbi:alpha/beta fold hydrolase [uncultured Hymenobacter sp.]|uniref:alpha/beta fold hydrolase n=1 Tax=uncultured Hymenobacter sp. TaxID=170016 RepID=UPI0035CC322C